MVDIKISCLTEVQPWGTAIADGLKSIETRTWTTHYRGLLGIHAGRKMDQGSPLIFDRTIRKAQCEQGSLLAVAELVECKQYLTQESWDADIEKHLCPFAWWEPGKWGWVLRNVRRIKPIAMPGHQGLWTWRGEVEFLQ